MSANKISVEVKEDFLERLSKTSSVSALAELIWNGLDAGSDHVEVKLVKNGLDGLEEIHIQDIGSGIPHDEIQLLFGNLGASWKKETRKKFGRSLHGKNGQGRFKAFALGENVTWHSIYSSPNGIKRYQIQGTGSALNSITYTEPESATNAATGTRVVIGNISKSHGTLLGEDAHNELAKLFAAYLCHWGIPLSQVATTCCGALSLRLGPRTCLTMA